MNALAPDFADAATLPAALPHVLAAPRTDDPIRLLCGRPKPNQRSFPESLTLTRATSVIDDFEASRPWLVLPDGSPDPRNQVSLMSARVLDLAWSSPEPRLLPGDNIAVDLDLACLVPGFDRAIFSQEWKQALWARFFRAAPRRRRRSVEQYRMVKRA